MKDLGDLKYLLGIEVLRFDAGVILDQRKYILELISGTGYSGTNPAYTPLKLNMRLTTVEYDHSTGEHRDDLLTDISYY